MKGHHLHTCVISFNRLDLTKQAISSYLETVEMPHSIVVVDNGSDEETVAWLQGQERAGAFDVLLLGENRYPGYATNRGFERAPAGTTYLHRADNDFRFLPGWCRQVELKFRRSKVGQVGLRTDSEEMRAPTNVGGNMVIRYELWANGLRYDERPWGEYPPGWSEDSLLSPAVRSMGYEWTRVMKPCIVSLASGDWGDPYYQKSYGDRGIKPGPNDPTASGIY